MFASSAWFRTIVNPQTRRLSKRAMDGVLLNPTSYVVIPARLHSTRLPRKLLLSETGQSLLQHTYEAAKTAQRPAGLCVAADHDEIANDVRRFGGQVVMTNPAAPSGTDRVAEVARNLRNADIVVNVQGDEPEIRGDNIDLVIRLLEQNPTAVMATLATPIRCEEQLLDPACVKAVVDSRGNAMYFSRSPIPHLRDGIAEVDFSVQTDFLQHIGLYAYRRDFLLALAELPPTRLEQLEQLEQLRVLDNGYQIQVGVVDEPSVGIDTPEDYARFVRRFRAKRQAA